MRCPKRRMQQVHFYQVSYKKSKLCIWHSASASFFPSLRPQTTSSNPSLGLMHTTQQNQPHPQIRYQRYLREFPIVRWQIRCGVDKESVISCDVIWACNSSFTVPKYACSGSDGILRPGVCTWMVKYIPNILGAVPRRHLAEYPALEKRKA
jgi:hypothetical protein